MPSGIEVYLRQYPNSKYVNEAIGKIKELRDYSWRNYRNVYEASFSGWKSHSDEQGYIRPENNYYLLHANSSYWEGAGYENIPPIAGNYLFQFELKKIQGDYAGIMIDLAGGGSAYSNLDFYIGMTNSRIPTYTISYRWIENSMEKSGNVIIEGKSIPSFLTKVDWAKKNVISIQRQAGNTLIYLNGWLLESFNLVDFDIHKIAIGISGESTVHLTSVTAKIP